MNNLVGEKFGRLIVIQRMDNSGYGKLRWLCQCNCGNKTIVTGNHLRRGHTKSCGCLRKNIIHGHARNGKISSVYLVWQDMRSRCMNPKNKAYHNYGGRGIFVCQRWIKFPNFLADMGECPDGCQIDRINNNKGYYRKNCRWVIPKQNNRNRRNNHLIAYNGKIRCIAAWAEEYNMNSHTLYARIYKYNWSIKKALGTPVRKRRKKLMI